MTALKLRLSPSENLQIAAQAMDLRAYAGYLRARQELYRWAAVARHNLLLEPIRSGRRFKELMGDGRRRWEAFPLVVLPA